MKKLIPIIFLILMACGSNTVTQNAIVEEPPPSVTTELPPAEEAPPIQPYVFQEIGDFINGMTSHIEPLPDGFWMVATVNGQFYRLNPFFGIAAHDSLPVQTYNDSGLMSFKLDPNYATNHWIYAYYTGFSEAPECQDVFCNLLVRFEIDEHAEHFLANPVTLATFPMVNLGGVHNGGGLAFGPDGSLYLGVGEGELSDEMTYPFAQDPNFNLGKILRINPNTTEMTQVALGVRNPFTAISTPDGMVIGDVGFTLFEEVDLLPWEGEANFGWPITEGEFSSEEFPEFTQPIHAFRHCDDRYKDEDPFAHDEVEGKAMVIKNHNGVVHPCESEIVTVAGYYPPRQAGLPDPYQGALDGTVIYSEPYYGWIRAFDLVDGKAMNDRHIAHFPGLTSITEGSDGYLYGLSIFAANRVLRLVPNY